MGKLKVCGPGGVAELSSCFTPDTTSEGELSGRYRLMQVGRFTENKIERLDVTTTTLMVEVGGFMTQMHNTTPHDNAKGLNCKI